MFVTITRPFLSKTKLFHPMSRTFVIMIINACHNNNTVCHNDKALSPNDQTLSLQWLDSLPQSAHNSLQWQTCHLWPNCWPVLHSPHVSSWLTRDLQGCSETDKGVKHYICISIPITLPLQTHGTDKTSHTQIPWCWKRLKNSHSIILTKLPKVLSHNTDKASQNPIPQQWQSPCNSHCVTLRTSPALPSHIQSLPNSHPMTLMNSSAFPSHDTDKVFPKPISWQTIFPALPFHDTNKTSLVSFLWHRQSLQGSHPMTLTKTSLPAAPKFQTPLCHVEQFTVSDQAH